MIGYCHQAKDLRTFRLSRFLCIEMTNYTFQRGNFNIKNYRKIRGLLNAARNKSHF
ncbi:WYL domain-containing protein [Paenibacillus lautus]|uniref:WYL domain-containing protein n=1 Tax=Paenibacillus lautus TaxID=1401 RepID=UPI003D2C6EC6